MCTFKYSDIQNIQCYIYNYQLLDEVGQNIGGGDSIFVGGEQINYLPMPKAEANN
jgi:hypothetical protein